MIEEKTIDANQTRGSWSIEADDKNSLVYSPEDTSVANNDDYAGRDEANQKEGRFRSFRSDNGTRIQTRIKPEAT